jgi:broad specificity phosphatase PhoE
MTTIYVIRHGVTDDFIEGRLQGQRRNGGLHPTLGMTQADAVARRLPPHVPFAALYTSDLLRAVETANLVAASPFLRIKDLGFQGSIGLQSEIKPDPRLREIDFGAWEGHTLEELRAIYSHERIEPYAVPRAVEHYGGESIVALVERIRSFWEMILEEHPQQHILIVSHAHAISALLCVALDLPLGNYWRFRVDPASLTTLYTASPGHTIMFRLNEND